MTLVDGFTLLLTAAGLGFFVAGTVGLLRFPDTHSRLHALTKADNLGLGLIVLGLLPQTGSLWLAAKLVAVWALALLAAATTAQLVARTALPADLPPARQRGRSPAAPGERPRPPRRVTAGGAAADTARLPPDDTARPAPTRGPGA